MLCALFLCTLVNQVQRTQMNLGTLMQFEQRENYVPIRKPHLRIFH
nr:MAG TPA: hypothetical protein [Bacteriophage sp.]